MFTDNHAIIANLNLHGHIPRQAALHEYAFHSTAHWLMAPLHHASLLPCAARGAAAILKSRLLLLLF